MAECPSEVSNDIRATLARLARVRGTRTARFSPEIPTHWSPTEVTSPENGEAFTDDGAWDFIADAIEEGAPIQCIELDKPPKKKGYCLLLAGVGGAEIYVKLQLRGSLVIGRSFHLSVRKG